MERSSGGAVLQCVIESQHEQTVCNTGPTEDEG